MKEIWQLFQNVYFTVGVLIAAGITFSMLAHDGILMQEQQRVERNFYVAVEERIDVIAQGINSIEALLSRMQTGFELKPDMSPAEFRNLVRDPLRENPGIKAAEWIPRVALEQLPQFERQASMLFPGYRVTRRQSQGTMVPVDERKEYFPVYYVEPFSGNEIARGFDLASSATRYESLVKARDSNALSMSGPIRLVQEQNNQNAVLVFKPVYRSGMAVGTVLERRKALLGFVLVVLRIGDFVEHAMKPLQPRGIDVCIDDVTEKEDPAFLYHHLTRTVEGGSLDQAALDKRHHQLKDRMRRTGSIGMVDRRWAITGVAAPGYFEINRWPAWTALAAGWLLTAFFSIYFVTLNRRNVRIMQIGREWEKAEHAMRIERDKAQKYFDMAGVMLIALNRNGEITRLNRKGSEILGYGQGELLGKEWITQCIPERMQDEVQTVFNALMAGEIDVVEYHENPVLSKSGEERILAWHNTLIKNGEGEIIGTLSSGEDITERKEHEMRLRQSAAVFESTAEGIFITDPEANITAVNSAFCTITGYSEDEALGQNPRLLKSGRHDQAFFSELWASLVETGQWEGEIWNRRKSGEVFPVWQNISGVYDDSGQLLYYATVFTDISKIKRTEEELRYLAHHDPLTRLPNRLLLHERLEQALKRAKRDNYSVAVLFLDLDRFKEINDSLGHTVGDNLLSKVADLLRQGVREVDTVARVSGDEFIVVLEDTKVVNAGRIARKLQEAVDQPLIVDNHELSINMSVGIAMAPKDGNDVTTLIKHADAALYRAKERGRNMFSFFSEEMAEASLEHMVLHNALRKGLERNEFLLHYQPQVDVESGKVIGTEALVRWQHPEMGLVSPARFIPLAEDTGLIEPIGEWVLREACRQMKQWLDEGLPMRYVSVNLAGRQVIRQGIIDTVWHALEDAKLAPKHLELELTESSIMDRESSLVLLEGLKSLGVRISIDDFGTGHSSLSRLKQMPIDKLKIDQSFVNGLPEDSDDVGIARAIIALADSLQMELIAEGVETEAQKKFLHTEGCSKVQGYLYSRPLPPDALREWLDSRQSRR